MTTGVQTVDRIGAVSGIPADSVFRRAKVLKMHRPPLWVLSKSGAGKGPKAGHVTATHCTNLLLAFTADPMAAAAKTVIEMRGMVPVDRPEHGLLFGGDTLGAALDSLIEMLSDMDARSQLYAAARSSRIEVTFRAQAMRRIVEIGFQDKPRWGRLFELRQRETDSPNAIAPPLVTTTFPSPFIEALADCVADSRQARPNATTEAVLDKRERREMFP